MSGEQKCARCGDPEFRIGGFCTGHCAELAKVEARALETEARVAELEKLLAERSNHPSPHPTLGEVPE